MRNDQIDEASFLKNSTPPARLTFDRKYFFLALLVFVVEVLIALFINDRFVRPYVGDFIVMFLIYYAVRTFLIAAPLRIGVAVLLFAYAIEMLQYWKIVERLHLQDNKVARTVIGVGFDPLDLLAYTLGIITVVLLERKRNSINDD